MPPRYRYTLEELMDSYPNLTAEEILADRTRLTKNLSRRGDYHNWGNGIKIVQCQKPGCGEMSKRIIDLQDGGRMRYCDTHYAEWFSSDSAFQSPNP